MTAEQEIRDAFKRLKDIDKVVAETNYPKEWVRIVCKV